jgi:hypothetical protein
MASNRELASNYQPEPMGSYRELADNYQPEIGRELANSYRLEQTESKELNQRGQYGAS